MTLSAFFLYCLSLLIAHSLQGCSPSASAKVFHSWGRVAFVRGGAADDVDERKTEFELLLRQAQVDPSEVLDGSGSLSPMRNVLNERKLPDLFMVCTMACVYESGILENGGKEKYLELKEEFARELGEQFLNAGIEQESWSPTGENEGALIEHCVNFMGSEYLHMSFFQVENFRQLVVNNPFWKGLVKAALITHLGEDCPNVNEMVEDNDLFSSTLLKCS